MVLPILHARQTSLAAFSSVAKIGIVVYTDILAYRWQNSGIVHLNSEGFCCVLSLFSMFVRELVVPGLVVSASCFLLEGKLHFD
jgi:hypothetical protein